ncbi:la-related protein 7 [Euwallacea fornicatus]|uniref:la-related protein 7 n=1 Tax=Euwallacea fornicatus TaxID=995702 RepID=UPI00338FA745
MGEGEFEAPPEDRPKKSRHRKKHLYSKILQQMEFYFSDANLSKDRYLSQQLSCGGDDGVDTNIFLKFNKIKKLNCTAEDIQKALRKSDLIGVNKEEAKIFRKVPFKGEMDLDVERRTVYVENIKADATHESLSQLFSDFGKVIYVSIPKYKHNRANKGFAFIEYETRLEAQTAISFFENIGCKIPFPNTDPEVLMSIATFEGNGEQEQGTECTDNEIESSEQNGKKRKAESDQPLNSKKQKTAETCNETVPTEAQKEPPAISVPEEEVTKQEETEEIKKRKKSKKDKRKNFIKDLGMQVLPKEEWKKLRNYYLNLQRKKMKEFKQYLKKQKHSKNPEKDTLDKDRVYQYTGEPYHIDTNKDEQIEEKIPKLDFTPGVIVKLKLSEPCVDVKKLKNELKAISSEVKYVDIPLPSGSEEVYVRFGTSEAANDFCKHDFEGEKTLLSGEDEKKYWEKIEADREVKFEKSRKKVRGRYKLLKRAEKELNKHIRFDEND